jgi:hypothetical protein
MDYKAVLLEDLAKGFSKSDLERLIGLPKNSLSGVLSGAKKLSKKSELKIEVWDKSDKPNPLEVVFNISDSKQASGTKDVKPKADDPKEGSMAFFNKYGCNSYKELSERLK